MPRGQNVLWRTPIPGLAHPYLSNADGDMLVVRAGATFEHIATNSSVNC